MRRWPWFLALYPAGIVVLGSMALLTRWVLI